VAGICSLVVGGFTIASLWNGDLKASPLERIRERHANKHARCEGDGAEYIDDFEGTWYWLRSPEQEKRVVMSLYNRYCIRCHGVDGRGIWDIPDMPDFTNAHWQATRTDGQLARAILEGRGSVMPPWRGALSLEEAWAMARYIRTFVPGTEIPKPDTSKPETGKPNAGKQDASKPKT
jgi:mono/diheme cytochrome c family protein